MAHFFNDLGSFLYKNFLNSKFARISQVAKDLFESQSDPQIRKNCENSQGVAALQAAHDCFVTLVDPPTHALSHSLVSVEKTRSPHARLLHVTTILAMKRNLAISVQGCRQNYDLPPLQVTRAYLRPRTHVAHVVRRAYHRHTHGLGENRRIRSKT